MTLTKQQILENGFPRGTRPVGGTFVDHNGKLKLHGVVHISTRKSEDNDFKNWRPHMCCMGDHGSRVSIAFSVWCLINDYHSPMDAWPRHADWKAVY